jgi:hypothetical protein
MTLDGPIPKPVALLALLGALCLSISGACTIQPALAEASGLRTSLEWGRDDEDDDTVAIRVCRSRWTQLSKDGSSE